MTNEERYKAVLAAFLDGKITLGEFCDQAERLGKQGEADIIKTQAEHRGNLGRAAA